jgi:integrase
MRDGRRIERRTWMLKYYKNGIAIRESSGTTNEREARRLLRDKETDRDRGLPVGGEVGKIHWEDAAADLITDYDNNEQSSVTAVRYRLRLHLTPVFAGALMAEITTDVIKQYTKDRRTAGAANGTINRELTILKRMFSLALENRRLLYAPYIPLLAEHNVRAGFFERDQFESVRAQLRPRGGEVARIALQGLITVAYVTGWRIDSEIVPLEWRQVDLDAGEIRLDPHTTKNDAPRTFPLTEELRQVFVTQQRQRDALASQGILCPWVFFRLVATKRGGAAKASPKMPKLLKGFRKAWMHACVAAGQPGKILHDFRRTAIRNMVRRGVPERVAMQLTGHKTRAVFERYNIVSPGDLVEARAKLEGLGAGLGGAQSAQTSSRTSS